MKTYNYTYYGTAIQKSRFEENVPKDWEDEYDDIKGYSYGGYDAVEVQKDEDDTQARDLINWVELSRFLADNESSVSRTRCPKKYETRVSELVAIINEWTQE